MGKRDTKILVLSRNYSTGLGVVRSLGRAGFEVDLIACTKKKGSSVIIAASRYVKSSSEVMLPLHQNNPGENLISAVLDYAEKNTGSRAVIFPTDDYTALAVDANRDVLREKFIIPEIKSDKGYTITDLMDKMRQAEIAAEFGLNVPDEWVISLAGDISIPENVCYPCFVKPLSSVAGYKTEMAGCNSLLELQKHLQKMRKFDANRSVLVQQYLEIDTEYDISGLCLGNNVIIPGVIEKTMIARFERGVTMAGVIRPCEILGDAVDKLKSMLVSLGYAGMVDVEFCLCGDRLYFTEINFRSGGPSYAYCLNGANLPAVYVNEVTGNGHDRQDELLEEYGKSFVYEKVAWEDYIHSFLTKEELESVINDADYTLLMDADDKAPGEVFNKRIRLSAMKHKVMRLFGEK